MAFLVFTVISTFLGQALNGKRCKAVAPKLDNRHCQLLLSLKMTLDSTMNVFHVER